MERKILGACMLACLFSLGLPLVSHAQGAEPVLIQVTFSKVNYVYTGNLASYSSTAQKIRFNVEARQVAVTQTGEVLWTNGEANLVINPRAIRDDDGSHSTQYCLDIMRSLAVHPNPELQLTVFVNAWRGEGPTLIVRTFDSCSLQAAST
jgi:hypothetical protein